MLSNSTLATRFSKDTQDVVAIMNNRADLERARTEHWYRIPVRTAPAGLLSVRWVAFYLTASFGTDKWSVRYWAEILRITEVRRIELLPTEPDHPRANDPYYRLALGPLQERGEPIFSRRRRRIVAVRGGGLRDLGDLPDGRRTAGKSGDQLLIARPGRLPGLAGGQGHEPRNRRSSGRAVAESRGAGAGRSVLCQ